MVEIVFLTILLLALVENNVSISVSVLDDFLMAQINFETIGAKRCH